jgi:hypothetical protein
VAIGDPRLVTATVVRRGQDAFDLVLQPQAETGMTNMIVWYGDLATVWTLEIGPGPRTADVVQVVTVATHLGQPQAGPPPAPAAPRAAPELPPQEARAETPNAPAAGFLPGREEGPLPAMPPSNVPDAPQSTAPANASPGTAELTHLEVRQSLGEVTGVFQAIRIQDGVMIKYRITNGGGSDLVVRPGSVLVKVNGRAVAYGMARDSIDRGHPEVLPRGASETGVIDAPGTTARSVMVIFSLFATGIPGNQAQETVLPVTFQPSFNGVDRLAVSPAP